MSTVMTGDAIIHNCAGSKLICKIKSNLLGRGWVVYIVANDVITVAVCLSSCLSFMIKLAGNTL